jgi:cobalamin biosynthesis protein CobW
VVVVNAEQVASGRDLEGTFEDQVSSADLLLLNKLDLVPESELPRIEARLRAIEPEAPILRTRHAAVSPELLFPPGLEQARRARRARAAGGAHNHEAFESDVLELEPGLAADTILRRIASEGALRAKGFVATDAGTRVVQGVGARIEIAPAETAPPPELIGRVVVIRRRRDAHG